MFNPTLELGTPEEMTPRHMETVKCISLWQPWASLVVCGEKRFETRGWPTKYRGILLIHAAKKFIAPEDYAMEWHHAVSAALDNHAWYGGHQLPRGAIIGAVDLTDCWLCDDDPEIPWPHSFNELLFGNFANGRYGWTLENPRYFKPIPYRGAQGFFNVPRDLVEDYLPKPWESES